MARKVNAEVCRDCGQSSTSFCKCKEFRKRIAKLKKALKKILDYYDRPVVGEIVRKALKTDDKDGNK